MLNALRKLMQSSSCALKNNLYRSLSVRAFSSASFTKDEVEKKIFDLLKAFDKVDPKKLRIDAHLSNDLGFDSLDRVDVLMAVEEEFNLEIPDEDIDKMLTVKDTVEYVLKKQK